MSPENAQQNLFAAAVRHGRPNGEERQQISVEARSVDGPFQGPIQDEFEMKLINFFDTQLDFSSICGL